MNVCIIGGKNYNVLVTEIVESFDIMYSDNTGRTISAGAEMTLDPLGTSYGHTVTLKRRKGYEDEFDELYTYISKPRVNGVDVEIVHNQTSIAYKARVTSGARQVKRIDEKRQKVYWDELSLKFEPLKAQVLPI